MSIGGKGETVDALNNCSYAVGIQERKDIERESEQL